MNSVFRTLGHDRRLRGEILEALHVHGIIPHEAETQDVVGHERLQIGFPLASDAVRTSFARLRDANPTASLALLDAQQRGLEPGWMVFDADSTLVDAEGIDELAARAGVGDEVAAITAAAMRGELDYEASLRDRTRRLAGLAWSEVEAVAAALPLSPGAKETVAAAQERGWKVAVVSGGFLPLVDAVAARLGLDHAAAHRLEVRDGKLTGEIEGPIVDAEAKATIARDLRGDGALIAVGDGANDVPLLEEADVGVSFCAKPVLEAVADVVVRRRDLRVALTLGLED